MSHSQLTPPPKVDSRAGRSTHSTHSALQVPSSPTCSSPERAEQDSLYSEGGYCKQYGQYSPAGQQYQPQYHHNRFYQPPYNQVRSPR